MYDTGRDLCSELSECALKVDSYYGTNSYKPERGGAHPQFSVLRQNDSC
jgi:hypothetical protein